MNTKRHTLKKSAYWIYGIHACRYALENPKRQVQAICVLNENIFDKMGVVAPSNHFVRKVDRQWFNSTFSEGAVHQGIALQVMPLPDLDLEILNSYLSPNQIVIILDQVSDPHNVGAILRSAAVFGATALIMTDRNAPPESATLAKAACGALEMVPIIRRTNLASTIKELREAGFWCYGFAESGSHTIEQVDFQGKAALIVGAEGDGMRRLTKELCDFLIHFRTCNKFTTLNVSTAAAIALHQAYISQHKAP